MIGLRNRDSESPFLPPTTDSKSSAEAEEIPQGSQENTGLFFREGFFFAVYWNASFAVFVYILPWIVPVDADKSIDTFRSLAGFSSLAMLVLLLNGLLAFCQRLTAGYRIATEPRTAAHHFLAACWTAVCVALWLIAIGSGYLFTM